MELRRICVFCGSSAGVREEYRIAATLLARRCATSWITIVYGGGNTGLMGAIAEATLASGGDVIGIIPRSMVKKEKAHAGLTELHIVSSMHERKALMYDLSDAFLALPGGYGTLEEFCEVLTWTQLGLQAKPCGILNVAGYYDAFLRFFDHATTEGFVKEKHRAMVLSATDPEELLERMKLYEMPAVDKWIEPSET